MPNLNGMGPQGKGPQTGRGRGICGIGIHSLIGEKRYIPSLLAITVPAVAAVVNDAFKTNSITRRLF
ncbi:DUF5320 family protein [Candidatus Latescibacterota bacterium]